MYYMLPLFFLLWGLYGVRRLPSLRDPAVVVDPSNKVWGPLRFVDDTAWTEYGRRVRWLYVRHAILGLAIAVIFIIVLKVLDHQ